MRQKLQSTEEISIHVDEVCERLRNAAETVKNPDNLGKINMLLLVSQSDEVQVTAMMSEPFLYAVALRLLKQALETAAGCCAFHHAEFVTQVGEIIGGSLAQTGAPNGEQVH